MTEGLKGSSDEHLSRLDGSLSSEFQSVRDLAPTFGEESEEPSQTNDQPTSASFVEVTVSAADSSLPPDDY